MRVSALFFSNNNVLRDRPAGRRLAFKPPLCARDGERAAARRRRFGALSNTKTKNKPPLEGDRRKK
jgi:hypothetical protein